MKIRGEKCVVLNHNICLMSYVDEDWFLARQEIRLVNSCTGISICTARMKACGIVDKSLSEVLLQIDEITNVAFFKEGVFRCIAKLKPPNSAILKAVVRRKPLHLEIGIRLEEQRGVLIAKIFDTSPSNAHSMSSFMDRLMKRNSHKNFQATVWERQYEA